LLLSSVHLCIFMAKHTVGNYSFHGDVCGLFLDCCIGGCCYEITNLI
jgi:hypothetical protein